MANYLAFSSLVELTQLSLFPVILHQQLPLKLRAVKDAFESEGDWLSLTYHFEKTSSDYSEGHCLKKHQIEKGKKCKKPQNIQFYRKHPEMGGKVSAFHYELWE